jgi:hypothetical protein
MIIALGLYRGFTALDAIGPYEILAYLTGAETVLCAETPVWSTTITTWCTCASTRPLPTWPARMCCLCPAGRLPVNTPQKDTRPIRRRCPVEGAQTDL